MDRKYYVFLGLFVATVVVFIAGIATGEAALIIVAFAGSLGLFIVRRTFIPRR